MKIYLAGPLFTHPEQQWLQALQNTIQQAADEHRSDVTVVWPYTLVSEQEIEALGDRAKYEIFTRCRRSLDESDIVVALLDGTQVDDGTAWELGYFCALREEGQHILGIRTDFRKAGDVFNAEVNLMIDCSCDLIVHSVEELLEELGKII